MGRKSKSSKAAEKKRERLEMEKKMNDRVQFVNRANRQQDPMDALPSFRTFNKKGLSISLTSERATALSQREKDWIFDLLKRNMQKMYEESDWGWDEKNKKEEMFEDNAWYLMARDTRVDPPALAGFSHFRYDMDFDDEVLYVYEIQLEETGYKRRGLGRFMMQVLEMLAFKADMRKIMLTVFKHNPAATAFFMSALKFEVDETSPVDDVYEQNDYSILSKFNKRKIAAEEREKAQQENNASLANVVNA